MTGPDYALDPVMIGDGKSSSVSDKGVEVEVDDFPETVLERVYIRDPALFSWDATMRRGKPHAELWVQTGTSLIPLPVHNY